MYRVIECITQEHHFVLLTVATLVCVFGSCLTVLVTRRFVAATGQRKRFQIFLAALIGGATIWSTHFIAMLAYDPGIPHGYDVVMTAVSLVVAVTGLFSALVLFGYGPGRWGYLAGGAAFGLTVSVMHYIGMAAFLLPGVIVWDQSMVLVSVVLGKLFAAAAFQRIAYPITRLCWVGGALLMILSIRSMHFVGMAAISLELSPLIDVPTRMLSDTAMGYGVFGVTVIVFIIGFIGLNIETAVQREARTLIQRSAVVDQLTGLPNRLALSETLSTYKAAAAQDSTFRAAALTIDLDRFKEVNDLHGHAAGDAVLKEIARRFSAACVDHEFIARSGGDEFVALKTGFRRIEEVKTFAQRLSAVCLDPVFYQGSAFVVGSSIGIASTLHDGADLDSLLQKSDLAMYRAKKNPDHDFCFFSAEMDHLNRERIALINDLHQAIERNEFELVYQFQNNVASRAPCGFEVLLRWNHPDHGRVSPGVFIPIAEETGLIRQIGLWVLSTACSEAATWHEPFSIAVNVAPQQLAQPSFVNSVSDILAGSGLAPERLELEVTEASIIDDQEHTLRVMHSLKAMGLRIAMDDFGTGYSSLATLQAFPFDKIKIDRSFVQGVHLDAQRAAIVRATVLLGAALEIPILAEGVEEEAELRFLRDENCDFVQGFLFGEPMALCDVRNVACAHEREVAS